MSRTDLKHCGKMPDAREELNRSVREWRMESWHSIKSLEGMESGSHDLGSIYVFYWVFLSDVFPLSAFHLLFWMLAYSIFIEVLLYAIIFN